MSASGLRATGHASGCGPFSMGNVCLIFIRPHRRVGKRKEHGEDMALSKLHCGESEPSSLLYLGSWEVNNQYLSRECQKLY